MSDAGAALCANIDNLLEFSNIKYFFWKTIKKLLWFVFFAFKFFQAKNKPNLSLHSPHYAEVCNECVVPISIS